MENESTGVMSGPHKLVIDTSLLGYENEYEYEYEYEYKHSYVCEAGGRGGSRAMATYDWDPNSSQGR